MKRYLLKLLAFVSIQCVIAALMWSEPPVERSEHYLTALEDKHEALLHRPGPRLVMVGGSSAAFGICSAEFQKRLSLAPVNMGIFAPAGLEFILRHAESHVQPGDVVLLCPEIHLLGREGMHATPKVAAELVKAWPTAAQYLPREVLPAEFQRQGPPTWKDYGDRLALQRLSERVRLDWPGLARRIQSRKKEPFEYSRAGFNEFGDMTGHHAYQGSSSIAIPPVPDKATSEASIRDAVSRINRFAEICEARQARVFFAYPPILQGTQPYGDELHKILVAQLRIRVLHHPDECTFARSDFFDTALHLGKDGAERRSRFLADRLQEQLSLTDDRLLRR